MRTAFIIAMLMLVAVPATAIDTDSALDRVAEAQRYIVGFYEMPDLHEGDEYEGEPVVMRNEGLQFLVVETAHAGLFQLRTTLDENVRYVEYDDPNYGRALFVPNDARYNDAGHYGSKKIGAETAWDRTLGSTAIKVAVIDSGLRKTHEEFAGSGRILQGYDFVSNDNDPNDNCGHGTHVTGTIAATINNGKGIAGLAQVSILPIRGLSQTVILCSGSTSALANALQYAGDQGAHFSTNSWGGGGSTSVNNAITSSHNKGTIHLAAAGNDGPCSNCVSEPWKSNADKVIIVGSTTSNDAQSSFSSEGPQVDVSAPGSDILSTYTSNDASYTTMSGTSMATPHVTGTAALVKSLNPSWGYSQIDAHLKSTAVDLGASGFDNKFGFGRISAAAATAPTTPTAPAAPSLTASAAIGQVSLSWSTPSNGGSAITAYKVYRGTNPASLSLRATLGVTNAYVDTGVTNGVTYHYQVSATNSIGEGARSNLVSATPAANQAPAACFTKSAVGLQVSANGGCSTDSDGSVTAWSWNWGDGTSPSSGSAPSHTYANAGTFTITLTVTDNGGATGVTSQSVTVTADPDPSATTLTSGSAHAATSGSSGSEQFYKIAVPAGASSLVVVLDGPACGLLSCSVDLDLYTRLGARPTDSTYDCRPYASGSDETCTHNNPASGWWYFRVDVFSGSNGAYTIRATVS